MNGKSSVVALSARVVLGVWFVYSGGVKIFSSGLDRFTRDVATYQLVKPPWDAVAAYTVPWLELISGVCLMLGILRRGAILTVSGRKFNLFVRSPSLQGVFIWLCRDSRHHSQPRSRKYPVNSAALLQY